MRYADVNKSHKRVILDVGHVELKRWQITGYLEPGEVVRCRDDRILNFKVHIDTLEQVKGISLRGGEGLAARLDVISDDELIPESTTQQKEKHRECTCVDSSRKENLSYISDSSFL